MKLWTVQMAQHRLVKEMGIPLVDITVKSGDHTFAPYGWALKEIKADRMEEAQYTKLYLQKMLDSLRSNRERWIELCSMEEVAIACYCRAGDYCHRLLLREYLERFCRNNGIEFQYMGEIRKAA